MKTVLLNLLTAFITLKCAGLTDIAYWSWGAVLIPMWILMPVVALEVVLTAGDDH